MSEKHRYDVGDYVLVPMRIEAIRKPLLVDKIQYDVEPLITDYFVRPITIPEDAIYSLFVKDETIKKYEFEMTHEIVRVPMDKKGSNGNG